MGSIDSIKADWVGLGLCLVKAGYVQTSRHVLNIGVERGGEHVGKFA